MSQRAQKPPGSKCTSSSMNARIPTGAISELPASWIGVEYLVQGGLVERGIDVEPYRTRPIDIEMLSARNSPTGVRLDPLGIASHEKFRCGSVPLGETGARVDLFHEHAKIIVATFLYYRTLGWKACARDLLDGAGYALARHRAAILALNSIPWSIPSVSQQTNTGSVVVCLREKPPLDVSQKSVSGTKRQPKEIKFDHASPFKGTGGLSPFRPGRLFAQQDSFSPYARDSFRGMR
ncbi:hypothetical protein EVAR_7184_1 [Eumeta japonica]|uniref:Uncharacterized protein n=1 Tax=Eumeta variegata TaxID=151549 RepID=A0A4C1U7A2_EUMVA|nr:hypothetical protein EVAR_7184_1 [Eumeta japonica]